MRFRSSAGLSVGVTLPIALFPADREHGSDRAYDGLPVGWVPLDGSGAAASRVFGLGFMCAARMP